MAETAKLLFASGIQVSDPTIVSDTNGRLWFLDPRDRSCRPVRMINGEEARPQEEPQAAATNGQLIATGSAGA